LNKARWIRALRFVSTMALMPNAVIVLLDEASGYSVAWWQVALCFVAIGAVAEPAIFKGMTWGASRAPAKDPVAPLNVRITCPSGRVIRCGVLRDPDADADGRMAWLVVPLENYQVRPEDLIRADAMPVDAILYAPGARDLKECDS
jgi:hypothetical protein